MSTTDPNGSTAGRALRELATELERLAHSSAGAMYLRHAARMARNSADAEDGVAYLASMPPHAFEAPAQAPGLADAVASLRAAGALGTDVCPCGTMPRPHPPTAHQAAIRALRGFREQRARQEASDGHT